MTYDGRFEAAGGPYPPAPWRMDGQVWLCVTRTRRVIRTPPDLAPVPGRWLVVALVRYLRGTLAYDELIVGPVVRRGARFGVLAERVWVDSGASLRGGRALWGIPKEPARFDWDDVGPAGGTVRIADDHGPLARITVRSGGTRPFPPVTLPAEGFGLLDGRRSRIPGRVRGRPAPARLRLDEWSPRLPPLTRDGPRRGVAVPHARFLFPPVRLLGGPVFPAAE